MLITSCDPLGLLPIEFSNTFDTTVLLSSFAQGETTEDAGTISTSLPASETRYIYSCQGRARIRECAAADSAVCPIIDYQPHGSEVQVLDLADGWYQVYLPDGRTGYVAAFLTSREVPAPCPTTVPTPNPTEVAPTETPSVPSGLQEGVNPSNGSTSEPPPQITTPPGGRRGTEPPPRSRPTDCPTPDRCIEPIF